MLVFDIPEYVESWKLERVCGSDLSGVLCSLLRDDPLDMLEHHLPYHCHPSTQHEAILEVW